MRRLFLALAGLSLTAGGAAGQDAALVQRGAAVFEKWCAPCHADGPGVDGRKLLPGTSSLALKYKGEKPALLDQRTDLTPELVRFFVRQGDGAGKPGGASGADARPVAGGAPIVVDLLAAGNLGLVLGVSLARGGERHAESQ